MVVIIVVINDSDYVTLLVECQFSMDFFHCFAICGSGTKYKLFLCGDFGYDDASFSILQNWHGDLLDVHPSLVLQVYMLRFWLWCILLNVAIFFMEVLAMMFHPFQCCKFLHGEFFDCVCILNVASFFVDIFNHNVNGLPKQQEEILGFFVTQIHYVLMKWDKGHWL